MRALIYILTFVCLAGLASGSDYSEPHRPQFHFTPAKNWMNDPNGMVFYEGEYHLFYQYNPFGDKWGHMSWGHAVSRDLVHWEHLSLALAEENNIMIFSGSAVVDWNNTSGFGKDGKPPLIAIYTGHHTDKKRQDQRTAFSNDKGRTWTKYDGNPVLDLRVADFRDPKVSWHDATKQWIMVVSIPIERKVGFYGSPDLKHWRPLSEFGPAGSTDGIWECPDLFPVKVETSNENKWVLIVNVGGGAPAGGSGCQYFVGEFDGRTFTADKRTHPRLTAEPVRAPAGTLLADFEDGYGEWTVTGDAFGKAPARGRLKGQMTVDGFLGKAFVNSFNNGDKGTGTLTSPEFEISNTFIHFLIGGGAHKGQTCMNLLVGGNVVHSATGQEAERLAWHYWDVQKFRGKKATLQVVDAHTEGWGHVNVDHIILSDQPVKTEKAPAIWADYARDFYAAVSWADVPKSDGRRLWIGWMSNWQYAQDVPTSPWRSAMTVPRSLTLRLTGNGYRLIQKPVKELEKLRTQTKTFAGGSIAEANEWLNGAQSQLLDLEIKFAEIAKDAEFQVEIAHSDDVLTRIGIDAGQKRLSIDRTKSGKIDFHDAFAAVHTAPVTVRNGELPLRILLDTSSVEVFGNDGESVLTDLILPPSSKAKFRIHSTEGKTAPAVQSLRLHKLKSAWKR